MRRPAHRLAACLIATAALAAPFATPAQAQTAFQRGAPVDQLRVGRHVVTVFKGSPPTSVNARNGSVGILVYERPHNSTFAAVAAQEIFEMEFKSRGGFSAMGRKAEMEIISHEIESLVASRYGGFNLAAFEQKEAGILSRYRQLRGMPPGEILARMRASRPMAEQWLAQNRGLVRTLVAYRFPR